MQGLQFRARLEQELRARHESNPRYSLRAFAAFLGTDHSTLSQILRGKRRAPAAQIRQWTKKLGLEAEKAAAYIAAEYVPDQATTERENQLRHWTAEAMAIVSEPAHWEIVRMSRTQEFRVDCRWMAERIGVTVDEVNMAFNRLLRLRLMETDAVGKWMDLTGASVTSEREFRKAALARVREKAAEWRKKRRASAWEAQ
jgi:transcriptional regulator with XRE-family HTH domain